MILVVAMLAAGVGGERLAVMPSTYEAGVELSNLEFSKEAFEQQLMAAVERHWPGDTIGWRDIGALLDFERQKDLLGCEETSCYAEISGALGARYVVRMILARVEGQWSVGGTFLDTKKLVAVRHVAQMVDGGTAQLFEALPSIIAELLGGRRGSVRSSHDEFEALRAMTRIDDIPPREKVTAVDSFLAGLSSDDIYRTAALRLLERMKHDAYLVEVERAWQRTRRTAYDEDVPPSRRADVLRSFLAEYPDDNRFHDDATELLHEVRGIKSAWGDVEALIVDRRVDLGDRIAAIDAFLNEWPNDNPYQASAFKQKARLSDALAVVRQQEQRDEYLLPGRVALASGGALAAVGIGFAVVANKAANDYSRGDLEAEERSRRWAAGMWTVATVGLTAAVYAAYVYFTVPPKPRPGPKVSW